MVLRWKHWTSAARGMSKCALSNSSEKTTAGGAGHTPSSTVSAQKSKTSLAMEQAPKTRSPGLLHDRHPEMPSPLKLPIRQGSEPMSYRPSNRLMMDGAPSHHREWHPNRSQGRTGERYLVTGRNTSPERSWPLTASQGALLQGAWMARWEQSTGKSDIKMSAMTSEPGRLGLKPPPFCDNQIGSEIVGFRYGNEG